MGRLPYDKQHELAYHIYEALCAQHALVGREEELELLLRRWSRAKTGEGQVVLLSGEAGIGKSRLTAALLERLTEPHTRLRDFCSPQHTDSAFYPIIGQMERAAGLAHDDTLQTQRGFRQQRVTRSKVHVRALVHSTRPFRKGL